MRIGKQSIREKRDEIKKSENIRLKALKFFPESSVRDEHNSPGAEITSAGEDMILVQPASHGLDLEQENIGLFELLVGAQSVALFRLNAVNAALFPIECL